MLGSDDSGKKPVILVLGSTGQVGGQVVEELGKHSSVSVRYTSRKPEQVAAWKAEGKDAVFMDMDQPASFGQAFHGVDRLFLVTGYSVAMLCQGKTLIDAAIRAGVQHVVKITVIYQWDNIDPHLSWHQLLDTYLQASGMAWTLIRPNCFMENVNSLRGGQFDYYWGNQRVGWVAVKDIAAVSATALKEGPRRHGGKEYWLSTEVLDGPQVAQLMTEELGTPIKAAIKTDEDFKKALDSYKFMEAWYGDGLRVFFREVRNGGMGYIGSVRDDVPFVTGKRATTFREYIQDNKQKLLASMNG